MRGVRLWIDRQQRWNDTRLRGNALARNSRLADNERLRTRGRRLGDDIQRSEIGRQPIALVHRGTKLVQALVRLSPDPAQQILHRIAFRIV